MYFLLYLCAEFYKFNLPTSYVFFLRIFRCSFVRQKKDAVVNDQYHSVHEMNDILVSITKIN